MTLVQDHDIPSSHKQLSQEQVLIFSYLRTKREVGWKKWQAYRIPIYSTFIHRSKTNKFQDWSVKASRNAQWLRIYPKQNRISNFVLNDLKQKLVNSNLYFQNDQLSVFSFGVCYIFVVSCVVTFHFHKLILYNDVRNKLNNCATNSMKQKSCKNILTM